MLENLKAASFLAWKSIQRGNTGTLVFSILIIAMVFVNLVFLPSIIAGVVVTFNTQSINFNYGNVVIERLENVVYVGRPQFGQANQRVSLFRLTPDGAGAERVPVLLGASSVNEIEIREGIRPGDVVILSDMSQYDGFDRVRIR